MADDKDRKLAKRLACILLEAGADGATAFKPALDKVLHGRPLGEQRRFLYIFREIYLSELAKDTLTIESAQTLDASLVAQIRDSFAANHPRPVHVQTRIVPELIAGIRTRMGDNVFDASVAGRLAGLAARIH